MSEKMRWYYNVRYLQIRVSEALRSYSCNTAEKCINFLLLLRVIKLIEKAHIKLFRVSYFICAQEHASWTECKMNLSTWINCQTTVTRLSTYLHSYVGKQPLGYTSHAVDVCIPRSSSLGVILVDRAWWCKDMFVCLQMHMSIMKLACINSIWE